MTEILIGTGNPGKVLDMIPLAKERGMTVRDGAGYAVDPDENGSDPAENAAIKARAYAEASGMPTVSFDSGLYFVELPMDDPRQPGLFVRRVNGRRLSDEETTAHYIALVKEMGRPILCQWVTGFAAALPDGRVISGDDREGQPRDWQFYLVDEPKGPGSPGKPLHCISVEADSGVYFGLREKDGSSAVRRKAVRMRALDALEDLLYGEVGLKDLQLAWPKETAPRIILANMTASETAVMLPEGSGRLEKLHRIMDAVLDALHAPGEAYQHLYGVSAMAALLAKRRGADTELAAMAGLLHDSYGYISGDTEDHAHRCPPLAEYLLRLCGTDEEERHRICRAVYEHSDKAGRHPLLSEILIDADVLQHVLYDPGKPVKKSEKARFAALSAELGLL
ncbi:MAG: HD domain-containing protein [Oscillospiraceae bacterium]|nr:HD domain-containing protein [Oscillospiraceae bacterium]